MLESKIDELISDSLKSYQNQSIEGSLTNIRNSAEIICKIIILKHYGKDGKKKYCNQDENSKSLNVLIRIIIQKGNKNRHDNEEILGSTDRSFIKIYMDIIRFNGNYNGHNQEVKLNMAYENVKISRIALKKLSFWLFKNYLKRPIPPELIKYISEYEVFISFNNANEEWVKLLVENIEMLNCKVFSISTKIRKNEIDENKVNQAIEEAKTGVLIYSAKKDEKSWIKEESDWLNKNGMLKSSDVISLCEDKKLLNNENIDIFNFNLNYKENFYNLAKKIDESINIDFDKIILPDDNKCLGMQKKICFALVIPAALLVVLGAYLTIFRTEPTLTPTPPSVQIEILTGDKGSTYYQIGEDIAEHILKDTDMVLEVKDSVGSGINLDNLSRSNKNKLTLAIVQSDVMLHYTADSQNNEIVKNLRILTPLFNEEIHLLVRKDNKKLNFFSDIENARIDIGNKDSGTAISTKILSKELGLSRLTFKSFSFDTSLKRLKEHKTDIVSVVSGQPINKLKNETNLKFLMYDKNISKASRYLQTNIHQESYAWNDKCVHTLSTQAYLVTYNYNDENVEKDLRKFVRAFEKNIKNLKKLAREKKAHKKWLEVPEKMGYDLPKLHATPKLYNASKNTQQWEYSNIIKDKININNQLFIQCSND